VSGRGGGEAGSGGPRVRSSPCYLLRMRRLPGGLPWLALAGLAAALPLLWVSMSGHSLVWRDTAQLQGALRPMIVESLRSLRLPAWNPWEGTGQPLFAQLLNGILHPVSLLVAALTPSTDALIVALVAFASAGAWIAARVLGASRPASTAAALAFAMSGFVLSASDNTQYLMSAATGPWTVAGLVLAAQRPAGWIAAAASVAALVLAGDPGSVGAFGLLGAGLAWAHSGRRGLVRAGLGSVLGFAAAAVQLVPSWLYMADTARGAGLLSAGDLHRWALAPWRLLELVAPGFFVGIPRSYVAPVFAALDGATPDRFPFTPSVFVGAPVILLALVGSRRSVTSRWLLGFAALFLWLSLGHRAGSQQLLSWVPLWGALRYWEKMVAPLTLCLALAAGLGIDGLDAAARRTLGLAVGACAVTAFAALAILGIPSVSPVFGPDRAVAELCREHLRTGLVHAAAGLGLSGAVLVVGRRWPRHVASAAAAAIFVQSAAASPFALHLGSPAALAVLPPALAAAPPGPRVVGPLGCDFLEGRGAFDAIDLLNACERRTGRPSTNAEAKVDSLATYSSLAPGRWEMIIGSGPLFWPLARRFSTSHVLAHPPASQAEAAGLQAATAGATGYREMDGGELLVWDVPHRPWAFFAPSVRVAPGRDLAGAMLAEELEAGSQAVVVETNGSVPAVSPGEVLAVGRGAEGVVIDAESRGEALLVVNDAWAPGWVASIDGADAEVMPADVLVRAVRWPPGRHRLRMSYEAPGLLAGAIVSGLAVAVALAAWLWQRRRTSPRVAS
jgi:hypothetical protein